MGLSRYKIVTIVLTVVAVALVSYSLSQPWYSISRSGDLSQSPDIDQNAGRYDFYKDFARWTSPYDHSVLLVYTSDDPIEDTMSWEALAVLIWVILAVFFLMSIVADRLLPSLVFGMALCLVALAAVVYFMVIIDYAISSSRSYGWVADGFTGDGFVGHDSIWSWGPQDGWYTVLTALVLQISAAILGIYALRLERNMSSSGPTDA